MPRHIDPQEAQEVVRLAIQEETASDGPTVESLAEALSLPVSEVERLLARVRGRGAAFAPAPRRTFGDRSAALSAALVLAIVVVVGLIGVGGLMAFSVQAPAPTVTAATPVLPAPPASTVTITAGDGRITTTTTSR